MCPNLGGGLSPIRLSTVPLRSLINRSVRARARLQFFCVSEDFSMMRKEAPLSTMYSQSRTDVVSRKMLSLPSYRVVEDKRTSFEA